MTDLLLILIAVTVAIYLLYRLARKIPPLGWAVIILMVLLKAY